MARLQIMPDLHDPVALVTPPRKIVVVELCDPVCRVSGKMAPAGGRQGIVKWGPETLRAPSDQRPAVRPPGSACASGLLAHFLARAWTHS